MGKLTRTQKTIQRNRAEREVNRLRRQGEAVPPELLMRLGWKRIIVREGLK